MNTHAYIAKVRAAGFSLAVDGGRLLVSPVELLSDTQRQSLRARKSELIAALQSPGTILGADCGHDLSAANCPLPARLATAAERVCREVHADSDDQVQAMLDDLVVHPPESWNALAEHFEGQLPPPPEPGYERIPMEAAGYAFEVDVPEQQAPAARASLQFRLKNGDGGSLLGAPGTSEEELREVLVAKYANRLESINEQPLP